MSKFRARACALHILACATTTAISLWRRHVSPAGGERRHVCPAGGERKSLPSFTRPSPRQFRSLRGLFARRPIGQSSVSGTPLGSHGQSTYLRHAIAQSFYL